MQTSKIIFQGECSCSYRWGISGDTPFIDNRGKEKIKDSYTQARKKMKRINYIIILLFLFTLPLRGDFKLMKEGVFEFHYMSNINPFTVEYVSQISKEINLRFQETFFMTNGNNIILTMYNDMGQFLKDQSLPWWQNYTIRSNTIFLNNIDLLLEKNFLQSFLKYAIFRINFFEQYHANVPEWILIGMALLYTDKTLFPHHSMKWVNFKSVLNKLHNASSLDEFEEAHYYCMKGVEYIMKTYQEDSFIKYMNENKSLSEFEEKFFNFTGMSYSEFLDELIGLIK